MWSAVVAALLAQSGGAAPSDWDCRLPQGIPGYEHELASAPEGPGALGAAYREAEAKLLAKVCGAADCPAVRAAIKPWRNGRTADGKTVCALAVVPSAAVNAFLQSLRDRVERLTADQLVERFGQVVSELLSDEAAHRPIALAISIDKIEVDDNFGGPAADFLRSRMETSLNQRNRTAGKKLFVIKDLPRGYTGEPRVPRGLDAVLTAEAQSRLEKDQRVLDVTWTAIITDPRHQERRETAAPVLIPAEVIPRGAAPVKRHLVPPRDPTGSLSVRLESRPGGSLCAGDRTHLWITSRKDRYVQVLSLYGDGEAILDFSGKVKADQPFDVAGKDGFEVVPGPVPEEAFLVVAAERPNPFLPLGDFRDNCRLRPDQAQRAWNWDGLPDTVALAGDGYRIGDAASCPKRPDLPGPGEVQRILDALPWCDQAALQASPAGP